MAAVALAALGMTLAVLVDRSDMRPGERTAFAVIAALAFLMLYCQWPLSSLRAGDMRSWRSRRRRQLRWQKWAGAATKF